MKVEKSPRIFEMVLSAEFDPSDGVLRIENRARPPATYGTALAIKLTRDEARSLGEALVGYANGA